MSATEKLPHTVLLKLDDIRADGGTQSRAQLSDETIADYAEKYSDGLAMPPVVVVYDGEAYWLVDGFHRRAAAESAGKDSILAEIRQGTLRDAVWLSYGANKEHDSAGLKRSPGDKTRALEGVLGDPEWSKKPTTEIAEHVGVTQSYVSRVKRHLSTSTKIEDDGKREVTRGGKTYTQDTSNIGKRRRGSEHLNSPATWQRSGAYEEPSARPANETAPESATQPVAEPNPAAWWSCPQCGSEFNKESARGYDWPKRGFCGHCEERGDDEPEPEPSTPAPTARPVVSSARIADLERLIEQRNADPEFAQLRHVQRAIGQSMPSRAQRMIDFALDGGELALLRLGLDWNVTPEALKHAYRTASRLAHPDRGGSQAEFVAINKAKDMIETMLGAR